MESSYGYVTQEEAPQETLSLLPALTLPSCRFSHATNTRDKIKAACSANDEEINFIEADVIYSSSLLSFMTAISFSDDSKQQGYAILGHSQDELAKADTDIRVLLYSALESQKGVKIDIKDYKAVQPCLDAIRELDEASDDGRGKAPWRFIRFFRTTPTCSFDYPAVIINADVITGTGPTCLFNSTGLPLSRIEQIKEARQFIKIVGEAIPYAILSLGWTTRAKEEGLEYSDEMTDDMEKVLEEFVDLGLPVTLAVRASYIRLSINRLSRFFRHPTVSFSVWSNCQLKEGEEEWIRSTLPVDRTAYDLPSNKNEELEGVLQKKKTTMLIFSNNNDGFSQLEAAGIGAVIAGIVAAALIVLFKRL
jgi:hypothetical protein